MRNLQFFIGLLAFLGVSCSHPHEKKLNHYKSKYAYATDKDWDRINLPNALIENNVWGKEFARNNFQIIFSDTAGRNFGWHWQYAFTTKRISATPSLVIGKKPWFENTTTPLLPAQVENIDSLYCSFEYTSGATGNYENSLELWITNKKRSNDKDIVFASICVFGDVGTDKLGTLKKTVHIGGLKMDEYSYKGKYMPFEMVLFYLHTKDTALQFNLKNYLNYLISNKYIKSTDYLSAVLLATSPRWGEGETVFNNFNLEIKLK